MQPSPSDPFSSYEAGPYFCELTHDRPGDGGVAAAVRARIAAIGLDALRARAAAAEHDLFNLGITFTVYSDATAIDRILPFDCIPRILTAAEWGVLEVGVKQRVAALNAFLHDIYHDRRIVREGLIPSELVFGNANYRPEMEGFPVRFGTYVHICGIDIVRDRAGQFLVLEDNARTPSGVSYVVENRHLMSRTFPDLMADMRLRPVDDYGLRLLAAMVEIAPEGVDNPQVVLLSPGIYNSAYFEHVFLAREMGVPLVEGADLLVEDDKVWMKTIGGRRPVHTIYRRIGDDFLDPKVFRPDSLLGVPGLIDAWRRGNVALANAVGTGVADDKAVYAYMPRIIRYYLGEDAILPMSRPTSAASRGAGTTRSIIWTNWWSSRWANRAVTASPSARAPAAREIEAARAALLADPANWISQPVVSLSVAPTLTEHGIRPRHLDLRPYAVTGRETWVLPGGLSRVALKEGSLVVNSSQGGGSKDTWVLADDGPMGGNVS